MKNPSTVTFLLTPTRHGGTHLRLEHAGFGGDIGRKMRALFDSGWGHKRARCSAPSLPVLPGKEPEAQRN